MSATRKAPFKFGIFYRLIIGKKNKAIGVRVCCILVILVLFFYLKLYVQVNEAPTLHYVDHLHTYTVAPTFDGNA